MAAQQRIPTTYFDGPVVKVDGVSCSYGDFVAVDNVSLTVPPGRIHALLGTNGAGKTTLLETIQGFRRPSMGELAVFGQDPSRHRASVAGRTGTMLQESGLVDEMTVSGQLALWRGVSVREDSVERVLDVVGLSHRRKVPVSVLSGGERRRLDFAMAIWGDPELVVLDEPTTGLDPQSRRKMWEIIRGLNAQGSTILLTTHYLDEAQSLAENVTILDRGRVAIEGPMSKVLSAIPAQIGFMVAAEHGVVAETTGGVIGALSDMIHGDVRTATTIRHDDTQNGMVTVSIRTLRLQTDVAVVADWAREHGLVLEQLRCSPASLEEVFLDMADAGPDAQVQNGVVR